MKHTRISYLTTTLMILVVPLFGGTRQARGAVINVLQNSGFESGTFSGWTVGGNSIGSGVNIDGTTIVGADSPFPPNFVNVRSGNFAAFALVQNGNDPVERIILSQTVPVLPSQIANIGFFLGNDSQSAFGMSIDNLHTQIFVNGVGLLPNAFSVIPTGSSSANFTLLSGAFNTGSLTSITVNFAINGSGTSRVGISADDFFVNTEDPRVAVVPEPASFVLWGLGTLVLAGGFRRSRAAKPA